MSSSPLFLDPIVIPLVRGPTVLDIGCGLGKWGVLLRSNFYDANLTHPPVVDALDAWEPMVACAEQTGCYRRVWQQEMPSALDGTWDTVLAIEVVEHLDQEDVDRLLDIVEGAATRRVVLSTPNWPAYRPGIQLPNGFSEYEAHKSYVARDHLRRRGYRLSGAGLEANPCSRVARGARRLKLHGVMESLTRVALPIADQIVAVKDC